MNEIASESFSPYIHTPNNQPAFVMIHIVEVVCQNRIAKISAPLCFQVIYETLPEFVGKFFQLRMIVMGNDINGYFELVVDETCVRPINAGRHKFNYRCQAISLEQLQQRNLLTFVEMNLEFSFAGQEFQRYCYYMNHYTKDLPTLPSPDIQYQTKSTEELKAMLREIIKSPMGEKVYDIEWVIERKQEVEIKTMKPFYINVSDEFVLYDTVQYCAPPLPMTGTPTNCSLSYSIRLLESSNHIQYVPPITSNTNLVNILIRPLKQRKYPISNLDQLHKHPLSANMQMLQDPPKLADMSKLPSSTITNAIAATSVNSLPMPIATAPRIMPLTFRSVSNTTTTTTRGVLPTSQILGRVGKGICIRPISTTVPLPSRINTDAAVGSTIQQEQPSDRIQSTSPLVPTAQQLLTPCSSYENAYTPQPALANVFSITTNVPFLPTSHTVTTTTSVESTKTRALPMEMEAGNTLTKTRQVTPIGRSHNPVPIQLNWPQQFPAPLTQLNRMPFTIQNIPNKTTTLATTTRPNHYPNANITTPPVTWIVQSEIKPATPNETQ